MVHVRSSAFPVLENYRLSANSLFKSMRRLSTGSRINRPGDSPAEYGIVENLKLEISGTFIARRNVENANDLIRSSDDWLQAGNDILKRMGELATGAIDGSKVGNDKEKLNKEYSQLKTELSRLSREAKFNSVQIGGRDQMLTYDLDGETFYFSQLNGEESYPLPVKFLSGLESSNQKDFLFDSSKDFTLSSDGRSICYADSNNNLCRYQIEEGSLERDSSDGEEKKLEFDELGRLWYATETSAGSGVYSVRQQDLDSWMQDVRVLSDTSITDLASPEFKIYDNRVYYIQSGTGNYVSRNLLNVNEINVEMLADEFNVNTTEGEFAISEQGRYIVDQPSTGDIRIINVETKLVDIFSTGASSVTDLSISVDSNLIAFNDLTDKSIYTLEVVEGEQPRFKNFQKVYPAQGDKGYSGISLDGGSHRGRFKVHNGPDPMQETVFHGADMRMHSLGISRTNILTEKDAIKALKNITRARERINNQRAVLGAAESRFNFSREGLETYENNLSMTQSRLEEVDMPMEVSRMTNEKIKYEAANSLIVQINRLTQVTLRLLTN